MSNKTMTWTKFLVFLEGVAEGHALMFRNVTQDSCGMAFRIYQGWGPMIGENIFIIWDGKELMRCEDTDEIEIVIDNVWGMLDLVRGVRELSDMVGSVGDHVNVVSTQDCTITLGDVDGSWFDTESSEAKAQMAKTGNVIKEILDGAKPIGHVSMGCEVGGYGVDGNVEFTHMSLVEAPKCVNCGESMVAADDKDWKCTNAVCSRVNLPVHVGGVYPPWERKRHGPTQNLNKQSGDSPQTKPVKSFYIVLRKDGYLPQGNWFTKHNARADADREAIRLTRLECQPFVVLKVVSAFDITTNVKRMSVEDK